MFCTDDYGFLPGKTTAPGGVVTEYPNSERGLAPPLPYQSELHGYPAPQKQSDYLFVGEAVESLVIGLLGLGILLGGAFFFAGVGVAVALLVTCFTPLAPLLLPVAVCGGGFGLGAASLFGAVTDLGDKVTELGDRAKETSTNFCEEHFNTDDPSDMFSFYDSL